MNHVHTVLHRVMNPSQPLSLSPRLLRLYDPCWGNGVTGQRSYSDAVLLLEVLVVL